MNNVSFCAVKANVAEPLKKAGDFVAHDSCIPANAIKEQKAKFEELAKKYKTEFDSVPAPVVRANFFSQEHIAPIANPEIYLG